MSSEDGGGSPDRLIDIARKKEEELAATAERDKVWFIIDTDRWRTHLNSIRTACATRTHWRVVQSNPCFEVWLYFHAYNTLPLIHNIDKCNSWKTHIPRVIKGGFNSDYHPAVIETAIRNAKNNYKAIGYFPETGSTQVWELAEELITVVKRNLDEIKDRFPLPVTI